jgi:antitoxin MazE
MKTTIVKWGNSRGIRLPKIFLESMNLTDNDTVEITTEENRIVIEKVEAKKRVHKTTAERIAEFDGEYVWEEWDTGPSVGNEI